VVAYYDCSKSWMDERYNWIILKFVISYNLHEGKGNKVIGFTTTYIQSVCLNPVHDEMYFDTTLCDKVCQWLPTDLFNFFGIPIL
jgi:hypothetical protein